MIPTEEVKQINGNDTGVHREMPKAPPTRAVHATIRPKPTTALHRPGKAKKFSVTFYSKDTEPLSLPNFAYAIAGTVLGHTKFVAYVQAEDPAQAAYRVNDYFEVAQIDLVEAGWTSMLDAPLRGTIVTNITPGFWARIFGL